MDRLDIQESDDVEREAFEMLQFKTFDFGFTSQNFPDHVGFDLTFEAKNQKELHYYIDSQLKI